jgi:hypothetical protein
MGTVHRPQHSGPRHWLLELSHQSLPLAIKSSKVVTKTKGKKKKKTHPSHYGGKFKSATKQMTIIHIQKPFSETARNSSIPQSAQTRRERLCRDFVQSEAQTSLSLSFHFPSLHTLQAPSPSPWPPPSTLAPPHLVDHPLLRAHTHALPRSLIFPPQF